MRTTLRPDGCADPGLASVRGPDWLGLVTEKGQSMTIKLSDTQLVMLSAAAQRDDRSLTPPEKLKGGAAHKVATKLIAAGLVKEVKAKPGTPVWRRDEQNGQSYALKHTAAGAKAIAVDPADDVRPAGDEERPVKEADRSPSFAQPGRTAAGAFAAPSLQALASPRAPRLGTKLAQAVQMLRAIEGADRRIVGSVGLAAAYNPRRPDRPAQAWVRPDARSIRCGAWLGLSHRRQRERRACGNSSDSDRTAFERPG